MAPDTALHCPDPPIYDCQDGNFLCAGSKASNIYHPVIVRSTDTTALTCFIDVEGGDKDFTIAICGENQTITKKFIEHFSRNLFLRPLKPGRIQRVCVCPMHRQVSLISPLENSLVTCFCIPAEQEEMPCEDVDISNGWRLVVENTSTEGTIRFFDVKRTSECFCRFPTLFSP